MLLLSLLTPILLLLACTLTDAAAVGHTPDKTTGQLAARSTTSAGITCYYQCPRSAPGIFYSSTTKNANTVSCTYYNYGRSTENCVYTYAGDLVSGSNYCPAKAEIANCSPDPNAATATTFKRAEAAPRVLTPAERAIKERQYRPKKRGAASD